MKSSDNQYSNILLLPEKPRETLLNVPLIITILIAFCFCIYFIPTYFFSNPLYIKSLEFFSFTPVLFKNEPLAFCYTTVSYSFMHGNFEHIAINMVWLLVFGSLFVRYFGGLRFLIFWVLTAIVSSLTYFVLHQDSTISLVGASGSISGMMGAIARYGFPINFDIGMQNKRLFGPLLPIKQALCSKIIFVYLSVWLVVNFIVGISSSVFEISNISIAWEAHMGGLFSGFLLVGFFDIERSESKIIV
ncbi:rhomboid family intramembrane serine protease [Bartonella sp. B10]